MVLKEVKNEESIEKKGEKFIYTQLRQIELDNTDLLQLAQREFVVIEDQKKVISDAKQKSKRASLFLFNNKKLIDEAKKADSLKYCQKCGMDFSLDVNKGMRSDKTKKPHDVLCKNCAKQEGL